jgi:hypothetical protein
MVARFFITFRLILYQDFVEVIKADLGVKDNFERFRELCEKAFLTIRHHGSLIISLLAMMISTGLPELSSEQVKYHQNNPDTCLLHVKNWKFEEKLF